MGGGGVVILFEFNLRLDFKEVEVLITEKLNKGKRRGRQRERVVLVF